jgi:hypothetical protein
LKKTKLHIISFDVPYPANYGGAIDVFYKIKNLAEAGAEIYLHCFEYDRPKADILVQYCKEVWYYPRKTGLTGLSFGLPYIVYSRRDNNLLQRLRQIDAPILFEGVHTTYYLSHPSLKNRLKLLRTHNIEHDYYSQLAYKEKNALKRLFFTSESARLKKYERKLNDAQVFLPLSMKDLGYFETMYPRAQHQFIAPFHHYNSVETKTGSGDYCLYHGNLAHPENIEAVLFLLNNVVPKLDMEVIIAGRKPTPSIITACKKLPNCKLVIDPAEDEMEQLIANAHIHLLPTFQPTGMKLKLLYALFKGRHVLVNDNMLHGTGLNDACSIANNAAEMIAAVNRLKEISFTGEMIANRANALEQHYDNAANARAILTCLQR